MHENISKHKRVIMHEIGSFTKQKSMWGRTENCLMYGLVTDISEQTAQSHTVSWSINTGHERGIGIKKAVGVLKSTYIHNRKDEGADHTKYQSLCRNMNFSFLQYHFQILMQDIAMQDGY
jgi:hypothetical protein